MGAIEGKLLGPCSHGKALAGLYCALMLDHMLDLLGVDAPLAIEGSFANNPILCGILATLRPGHPVQIAQSDGGVINGCWRVTQDNGFVSPPALETVTPLDLPGLVQYRTKWKAMAIER